MKKKLETREDGKTRIILDDGSMGSPWFKNEENALRFIGKNVLKYGDWVSKVKWKILK